MATSKTLDSGDKRISVGRWMHAWVNVTPGNCALKTVIWTNNEFTGFTGGVRVALSDRDGTLLYQTPLERYGVDGKLVPFKSSRRVIERSFPLGAGIYEHVDRIDVALGHAGKNRLIEDVEVVLEWLRIVIAIGSIVTGDTPEEAGNLLVTSNVQALMPTPPVHKKLRVSINPVIVSATTPTEVLVTAVDIKSKEVVNGDLYAVWSTPIDLKNKTGLVGPLNTKFKLPPPGRWMPGKQLPNMPPSYAWRQQRLFAVAKGYDPAPVTVKLKQIPPKPQTPVPAPPLVHT